MTTVACAPPPVDLDRAAFLLDVDGTLLDLATVPSEVRVPQQLTRQLEELRARVGGALSLISGRPIVQLDGLFRPLLLPCAGVHGLERRAADGGLYRAQVDEACLEAAGKELVDLIAGRSDLMIEFKPGALALHYRRVPAAAEFVRMVMGRLAGRFAPRFGLIDGDKVVELVPAGVSKAAAVDAFMAEPPFAGRTPIYVGDDTTDFDGFTAVRRYDGFDIAVGDRVSARWRLGSPASVRQWIGHLIAPTAGAP